MSTSLIVTLVIIAVLVAATVGLYFFGKKMQKKQEQQEEAVQASKQPVTMLIIDKKKMRLKEAGLPQAVIDSTPKYLRRAKLPIVKAKVGPQIMNLVADDKIYDDIPVKKQVRAMVSGIYIVEVKGVHGQKLEKPQPKKKNFIGRFMDKVREIGSAGPSKKVLTQLFVIRNLNRNMCRKAHLTERTVVPEYSERTVLFPVLTDMLCFVSYSDSL